MISKYYYNYKLGLLTLIVENGEADFLERVITVFLAVLSID